MAANTGGEEGRRWARKGCVVFSLSLCSSLPLTFFRGAWSMDARRPGLAQEWALPRSLWIMATPYILALKTALSVSSVRARTQIDRRLDVSPGDYLASRVVAEREAVRQPIRLTTGSRNDEQDERLRSRKGIYYGMYARVRESRITFSLVARKYRKNVANNATTTEACS